MYPTTFRHHRFVCTQADWDHISNEIREYETNESASKAKFLEEQKGYKSSYEATNVKGDSDHPSIDLFYIEGQVIHD